MTKPIPAAQLLAYSVLSLPLAMSALPVYVHVPKLYASFGLSLAWLGIAMLALRAADAFIDPMLGRWTDRSENRKRFIAIAAVPLAVGLLLTFAPQVSGLPLQTNLLVGLALTYLGFSAITIAYHAWGAEWSTDVHERTRITTWREAAGLIGVLIAAALPVILAQRAGLAQGYAMFAWIVVVVLAICAAGTLKFAPSRARALDLPAVPLRAVLADRAFVRLVVVFALNGIAAAIPATLFLFFIDDVVRANDWQAQYLIAYFISGALAAPLWLAISKRVGKRRAWGASMLVAIFGFIWAYGMGADDRWPFMIVCVLSGLALGADLTLPPSMLADVIGRSAQPHAGGSYFGVWTMVTKLNLALAAGIALPALAWLGYVPNAANAKTSALTIAYCLLPCALKLCAFFALFFVKESPHVEEVR